MIPFIHTQKLRTVPALKYEFNSQSSSTERRKSDREESEVGRGGSRSDRGRGRGRGRGKGPARGGKRETKTVEPKKYEEPEVKVRRIVSRVPSRNYIQFPSQACLATC